MTYLTPKDLAARYDNKISLGTLANWRWKGAGPEFVKLGGRILYAVPDVEKWEASSRRTTVGQAGMQKAG